MLTKKYLENRINDLRSDVDSVNSGINHRVTDVQHSVDKRIIAVENNFDKQIVAINHKNDIERNDMWHRIQNLEDRIETLEAGPDE